MPQDILSQIEEENMDRTPEFNEGGQVPGNNTTGDQVNARHNSREWVFTESQMNRLCGMIGASSRENAFRKVGGNPSVRKYDSRGTQKFASGGGVYKGKDIDAFFKEFRKVELDIDLESIPENIRELTEIMKMSVAAGERAGSPVVRKIANDMAKATRALISLAQKDDRHLTQDEIKRKNNIIADFLDEWEFRELNHAIQSGRRADETNSGFKDRNRSIGLVDSIKTRNSKTVDYMAENIRNMLGGNPSKGLLAGAGLVLGARELNNFLRSISSIVEEMAKLNIQAGHVRASMNAAFGSDVYDRFRESMVLTRREMRELAPAISDAYRKTGISLEQVEAIAGNIKESFGAMDAGTLRETLSMLKNLGEGQIDVLFGRTETTGEDRGNLTANLSRYGDVGKMADMLEQGVFGETNDELQKLTEGDRKIVENLQKMNVMMEDVKYALEGKTSGPLSALLPNSKGISAIIPIANAILEAVIAIQVSQALWGGASGGSGGGLGGALKALGKGGKAASVTTAVGGLAMMAGAVSLLGSAEKHFADKSAKNEAQRRKNTESVGLAADYSSFGKLDWDKINERGAKYAKWGAGIGGVAGTIGATAATTSTGGVGALGGATIIGTSIGAGSVAGYGIGAGLEINKQLGKNKSIIKDETGNDNQVTIAYLENMSRKVKELQDLQKETRKILAASLRSLEKTQTTLKKVSSGAYTGESQANIATARKSIQMIGMSGGTTEQYAAHTRKILDESARVYAEKTRRISEERDRIINDESMQASERAEAMRNIISEQADATREFVESIKSSIGEYDKIPTVIRRNLELKMREFNFGEMTKNMVGISTYSINNAGAMLSDSIKNFQDSFKQGSEELDRAKKEADQQTKNETEKLKKQYEGKESTRGLFNEKGKFLFAEAEKRIADRNNKLEEEKEKAFGKDYKAVEALRERLNENSKSLDELNREYEGKEWNEETAREYDEKRLALLKKQEKELENFSRIENINPDSHIKGNALRDIKIMSEKYGGLGKKSIEELKEEQSKLSEKLDGLNNGSSDERKEWSSRSAQIQKEIDRRLIHKEAAIEGSGLMMGGDTSITIDTVKQKSGISKIENEAKDINTASQAFASVSDNETILLQKITEWHDGLKNQLLGVQKSASALLSMIENNPDVQFANAWKKTIEARRDYLMQGTGGSYTYLEKSAQAEEKAIASRETALEEVRKRYITERDNYRGTITKTAEQSGIMGSDAFKGLMTASTGLADARRNALENPTDQGLQDAVAASEKAYDDAKKEFEKIGKDNEAAKKIVNSVEAMINALNSIGADIEEQASNIKSMRARQFKNRLNSTDVYKEEFGYMGGQMSLNRSGSRMQMLGAELDIAGLTREAESRRGTLRSVRDMDIKGIQEHERIAIENINKNENLKPEEKNTQIQMVQEQARAKEAEVEYKYKKDVAACAKEEYALKMKVIGFEEQALSIQQSLLESIGGPVETIVSLETERLSLALKQRDAARDQYERVIASDADAEEKQKALLQLREAEAKVIKNQYGAQNSMMEKLLGHMIGAWGEVSMIKGPNNLASQFGMGYIQLEGGMAAAAGSVPNKGYRDRLFASNEAARLSNASGIPVPKGIWEGIAGTFSSGKPGEEPSKTEEDIGTGAGQSDTTGANGISAGVSAPKDKRGLNVGTLNVQDSNVKTANVETVIIKTMQNLMAGKEGLVANVGKPGAPPKPKPPKAEPPKTVGQTEPAAPPSPATKPASAKSLDTSEPDIHTPTPVHSAGGGPEERTGTESDVLKMQPYASSDFRKEPETLSFDLSGDRRDRAEKEYDRRSWARNRVYDIGTHDAVDSPISDMATLNREFGRYVGEDGRIRVTRAGYMALRKRRGFERFANKFNVVEGEGGLREFLSHSKMDKEKLDLFDEDKYRFEQKSGVSFTELEGNIASERRTLESMGESAEEYQQRKMSPVQQRIDENAAKLEELRKRKSRLEKKPGSAKELEKVNTEIAERETYDVMARDRLNAIPDQARAEYEAQQNKVSEAQDRLNRANEDLRVARGESREDIEKEKLAASLKQEEAKFQDMGGNIEEYTLNRTRSLRKIRRDTVAELDQKESDLQAKGGGDEGLEGEIAILKRRIKDTDKLIHERVESAPGEFSSQLEKVAGLRNRLGIDSSDLDQYRLQRDAAVPGQQDFIGPAQPGNTINSQKYMMPESAGSVSPFLNSRTPIEQLVKAIDDMKPSDQKLEGEANINLTLKMDWNSDGMKKEMEHFFMRMTGADKK